MKRIALLVVLGACSKSEDKKSEAPAAGKPGVISGEIDVKPELKEGVANHVVFVSAKSPGGKGPPLAAKKLGSVTVPMSFSLSADDQMIQGGPPFDGDVEITVRFDGDGDVMTRAPGDLVWRGPATVGGAPLKIVVSEAAQ
jgi:hypothetical protein